jgi:hypothetical protein
MRAEELDAILDDLRAARGARLEVPLRHPGGRPRKDISPAEVDRRFREALQRIRREHTFSVFGFERRGPVAAHLVE